MSDRVKDMVGKVVSEEEVATSLGFKDVFELRRWETDLGFKVSELEAKVREVQGDCRNFLWTGRRMECVLRKVKEHLTNNDHGPTSEEQRERKLLLLAIGVVLGESVDWNKELEDYVDLSGRS